MYPVSTSTTEFNTKNYDTRHDAEEAHLKKLHNVLLQRITTTKAYTKTFMVQCNYSMVKGQ